LKKYCHLKGPGNIFGKPVLLPLICNLPCTTKDFACITTSTSFSILYFSVYLIDVCCSVLIRNAFAVGPFQLLIPVVFLFSEEHSTSKETMTASPRADEKTQYNDDNLGKIPAFLEESWG